MRSFSQLTVLATVAFATLAAAAPVSAAPVVTPKHQLSSLPTTLAGLRDNLSPTLNSITTPNATSATLDPLVTQVSSTVSPAVAKVSALAGSPLSTILGTTNASSGVVSPTQAVLPTFGDFRPATTPNLTPADQTDILQILTRALGPRLGSDMAKLVARMSNRILNKIPLTGVIHSVVTLVNKLLRPGGTLEELLGGGHPDVSCGGREEPLDQRSIQARADSHPNSGVSSFLFLPHPFLALHLPPNMPYTAKYIVKVVATISDGLLGKIPLSQALNAVTGLLNKVNNPTTALGSILGTAGAAIGNL
ncbi:hypothetical protein GGX14DRAFT_388035 [Mycena pura]|uniref:Uncharacterized protein n=1 Tax=Mycena pura TaxID=153505 RepID=A0AAD6VTC3_9AGAR|nr:hypothetical protein GGX14DRAFT_388035 [Mycena pura]